MIQLSKIKLAKSIELPVKCNLNVLEAIQKEYGTVAEFEKRIVPFREVTVGEEIKRLPKEPDIGAVTFGLTLMVLEGIEIDREENHTEYTDLSRRQLLNVITRDYRALANDIHEELRRCFEIKK
ncbi:MAG: hypothetical protein E7290_02020 [Lachnospiraceae bacterium]|nr:hypothetical protein [Lachnospiraceae bacterium]